jgi:hypothetical protein
VLLGKGFGLEETKMADSDRRANVVAAVEGGTQFFYR